MSKLFVSLLQGAVLSLLAAVEAFAQAAPGVAAGGAGAPVEAPTIWGALRDMLPMLAFCYLILYFIVIRPQDSKNKKHKALLESIKRGDSVVTTSGIMGKVVGVEKDHLQLEIAPNVKVKFVLSAVARLESEQQKSKAA